MGAAEVDVAVGDRSHADLVERPREEGGKGAGKGHSPVTGGTANCNAHLKEGCWTTTVISSFISGFQSIICGTSCPKNLARSSCSYLLVFPTHPPSIYSPASPLLHASTDSCYC